MKKSSKINWLRIAEYIIGAMLLSAIGWLWHNMQVSEYWEYQGQKTIIASLLTLDKRILAQILFLSCVTFPSIIGFLIWRNSKLKKTNKQFTKELEQEREFFHSCGLQWKVIEFKRYLPKTPFPYCNCHSLPMAQSGHSEYIFECPMTGHSFTLKHNGKQITHNDALKIVRKEIQNLLNIKTEHKLKK